MDGSICVENYHAILETVKSSIRDSLKNKGARVAVLNDEAHHIANENTSEVKRWKEFLDEILNSDFGTLLVCLGLATWEIIIFQMSFGDIRYVKL